MSAVCEKCGRELPVTDAAFCPFCGAVIPAAGKTKQEDQPEEVREWLRKIEQAENAPARAKMVQAAQAACPDCLPIEWEALFVGRPKKAPRGQMDFSVIKSYLLHIYWRPEEIDHARKEAMRTEIFGDPQLEKCLGMSDDPQRMMNEYLERLCEEYMTVFLAESAEVNRTLLGFRLERNRERAMARPVARMLVNIRADEKLTGGQRDLLYNALMRAFSVRVNGQTQWLEAFLSGTAK